MPTDQELDRDWVPNARRPQSTIAQAFSQELMGIFRIDNSVADLDEHVSTKKRQLYSQSHELQALEARLHEMEERLRRSKPGAELAPQSPQQSVQAPQRSQIQQEVEEALAAAKQNDDQAGDEEEEEEEEEEDDEEEAEEAGHRGDNKPAHDEEDEEEDEDDGEDEDDEDKDEDDEDEDEEENQTAKERVVPPTPRLLTSARQPTSPGPAVLSPKHATRDGLRRDKAAPGSGAMPPTPSASEGEYELVTRAELDDE